MPAHAAARTAEKDGRKGMHGMKVVFDAALLPSKGMEQALHAACCMCLRN
jgi:hypothetical protein